VSAQVNDSITVQYVEVPVTVVDRGGNPIRGLTKANFEIFDEGKKRDVGGFETVDFASAAIAEPGTEAATISPAARRNFLLVFDLSYASPLAMTRAKDAARKFVTDMVGTEDRVGVATVDVEHGFHLLTSFTTDRSLVASAIEKPANFTAFDPLQLAGNPIDPDVAAAMNDAGGGRAGGGDGSGGSSATDVVRELNRQQDVYNRNNIERELNLLSGLSQVLRAVKGQKHLVLLSEGFDPRLIQGRDAGIDAAKVEETAAIERGAIWTVDNDNRFGSSSSLRLLDKMVQIAKRSDVVFDVVDIHGLRTDVDPRTGYQHKSNEGLHLLASATGGTMFQNSNDIATDFQRVLKAEEVVYVLAFQASAAQPGRFHEIQVKLVNVPGGRAIARRGYYEAGAGSEAERTLSNAEIVVNDIPQDAVHVAALVASFATSGSRAQVPVVLEINGEDITKAAKGNQATLEIFTYAFDNRGLVRDSMFQRVNFDLAKTVATLRQSGVKYYATLSLPSGKYAVKNLVRVVESDKKGFSRTDVAVPEPRAFTVSQPFFMDEGSRWLMVKGGSHDRTNAPYPFAVKGESFVPAAGPRPEQTRKCVVFVSNALPDELTVNSSSDATPVAQVQTPNGTTLVFQVTGDGSKLEIAAERHER
jgi:VWFA-related protein